MSARSRQLRDEADREARTSVAGLKTPERETARFALAEVFELGRLVRIDVREMATEETPTFTLMFGLEEATKIARVLAQVVDDLDRRATREQWARRKVLP